MLLIGVTIPHTAKERMKQSLLKYQEKSNKTVYANNLPRHMRSDCMHVIMKAGATGQIR